MTAVLFRQLMRDAAVAINTGRSILDRLKHDLRCRGLLVRIHRFDRMTIAAFMRVICLHCRPDMLGELETVLFEFLWCVDGARNVMKQLIRSLDFSPHFINPFFGNMAIRTNRTNA